MGHRARDYGHGRAGRLDVRMVQWPVTTLVQTMYSGTNNGFIVHDANEGGTTTFTQIYDSRDTANQPQLVLQWR